MNQESGKGILFGVLGIMTLIIAILGASLAYFTAQATGSDTPIEVQAATVTIGYTQGETLNAGELIPAEKDIALAAYSNERGYGQCIDKKGFAVCGIFSFYADNTMGKFDQTIVGTIETTTDLTGTQTTEFENLSYTVFEGNCTNPDDTSTCTFTELNEYQLTKFGKYGQTTQVFDNGTGDEHANEVTVEAGKKRYFQIVFWLNEAAADVYNDPEGTGNQDFEQGLSYSGTVKISVSGASGNITGTY